MVVLWEFRVPVERRAEFLVHYGPDGTWARLFRRAAGFKETLLLEDAHQPGRFLNFDRWTDEESYRAFRRAHAMDYDELDRRCTGLADEREVGSFAALGDGD